MVPSEVSWDVKIYVYTITCVNIYVIEYYLTVFVSQSVDVASLLLCP